MLDPYAEAVQRFGRGAGREHGQFLGRLLLTEPHDRATLDGR